MRALIAEGSRLHRRGQADAARRRARAAAAGRARVPGGGGARPGRAVDLAVLPPDSAAAVRHGRLPAHASAFADAARAVPPSGGRGRAAVARGGAARAAVRRAAGRASGRRRARSRTRWCRSWRAPGFQWMATDEEILARTLGHGVHARRRRPRRAARACCTGRTASGRTRRSVACGFRDHALSDLIGFTYAVVVGRTAPPTTSSHRLVEAGRRYQRGDRRGRGDDLRDPRRRERVGALRGPGPAVPPRALRPARRASRNCATVTMSEACAGADRAAAVDLPGLVDQRRLLHLDRPPGRPPGLGPAGRCAPGAGERRADGLPPTPLARAREEMLIAEGSDWFWWYGDDHSSEHDLEFDELFRRHVRNVYRALEQADPRGAVRHQHHDAAADAADIQPPTGFMQPVIDGEVTSYFEWVGAGCVEDGRRRPARCTRSATAAPGIDAVEFGVRPRAALRPGGRHRARCASMLGGGCELTPQVPEAGRPAGRSSSGRRRRSWRQPGSDAAGGRAGRGRGCAGCGRRSDESRSSRSRSRCLGAATATAWRCSWC